MCIVIFFLVDVCIVVVTEFGFIIPRFLRSVFSYVCYTKVEILHVLTYVGWLFLSSV